MTSNVDIVRAMYDAFASKDEHTLRTLLHPDTEWIQCRGFPGGDTRRGVDEVIDKVFGGLRSTWEGWRVDIDEYLDAGTAVVVTGEYAGTHRETGRAMTAVFAHIYDVHDGRITRFRQYTDTHEIVSATRP